MDEDELSDMHVCLVCQMTLIGLMNYVNHKKHDCVGRKGVRPSDSSMAVSTSINATNQVHIPANQILSGNADNSPGKSHHFSANSITGTSADTSIDNGYQKTHRLGNMQGLHLLASQCQTTLSCDNSTHSTVVNPSARGDAVPHTSPVSSCNFNGLNNNSISVDIQDSFPSLASVTFSPGTSHGVDPNMVMNARPNMGKSEDFFSSLALQSKSNAKDSGTSQQESVGNLFPHVNFDKDGSTQNNENELPITKILNSLQFSDDDDVDIEFDEDFLEEAFSDDSDYNHPPPNHTRGKWKPGQGPERPRESGGKWKSDERRDGLGKYRSHDRAPDTGGKSRHGPTGGKWRSQRLHHSQGKWKPGQYDSKKEAPYKPTKPTGGKKIYLNQKLDEYLCKPCGVTYKNRFAFSRHCAGKKHKENVKASRFSSDEDDNEDEESIASKGGNSEEQTNFNSENVKVVNDSESNNEGLNSEPDVQGIIQSKFPEQEIKSGGSPEIMNSVDDETQENIQNESESKHIQNHSESLQTDVDLDQPRSLLLHCTICDRKFYSKYVLARHFLSALHRNRTKGHPDAVRVLQQYHKYVVRLSPYQCSPCQYYFNQEPHLLEHLKSSSHAEQCQKLPGELICTLCRFSSGDNEKMIEHMKNPIHIERAKKSRKLCIIKEKYFKAACKFCGKQMHSRIHMKRHIRNKHRKSLDIKGHILGEITLVQEGIYACDDCDGKKFKSYNAFVIHKNRRHGNSETIYCYVCDKTLLDKYTYERHVSGLRHKRKEKHVPAVIPKPEISETDENKPTTEISEEADVNFMNIMLQINQKMSDNSSRSLEKPKRNHVKRKSEKKTGDDKIYKCDHCEFSVTKYADLRPHYMEVHSSHILVCELCDITFLNEKSLKLHHSSRQHQANLEEAEGHEGQQSIFQCEICNKRFTDEAWKQFHIDVYHLHPNSEESLLKQLGRPDITVTKYEAFLQSIKHLERGERVECVECGKSFKKDYILEHLRMHTGDKPFKCRYCNQGFMASLSLRRHLLTHLGLTERKCEICGREYKKVESYKAHMKQHRLEKAGAQKLICDVCGMAFYLPKQLKSHMRRHGEKKFKCTVTGCHWSFYFGNELDAHMKSHTKVKPYLCDICGYSSATKNRLRRHARTHTGERNYHCEYCTYKAGTNTHLRRHMRIHIGSKPYKCPYCDYSCNTHENIRKHIMKTKKHEGLYIYPCKFCTFGFNTVNEFRFHLKQYHPEHYDEEKSNEGLAAMTGLYVKEKDPRQPTEGMRINQVKERKVRKGKKEKEKKEDQTTIIIPPYAHEEVVSQFQGGEYSVGYPTTHAVDMTRSWQHATQMETDNAVRSVIATSGGEMNIAAYNQTDFLITNVESGVVYISADEQEGSSHDKGEVEFMRPPENVMFAI